jgi:hypothetical protein
MGLFATALNDLGWLLTRRFAGRYAGPVEAAGHSAERLVQILAGMPFFRDVEQYEGLAVPFYKRAQLTVADLALTLGSHEFARFDDLDHLTMFADNLVPHVLRRDGILCYSSELAKRIDEEALIPAGSAEEVEIRACALHAVELICQRLRSTGERITSMGLDFLLWNRGQQSEYNRTRTVFY